MRAVTDPAKGVYSISVAAEMTGMDPESLRLYERKRLVTPARTPGGARLYSTYDIHRLHRIADLLDSGVDLPGIARVLGVQGDDGTSPRPGDVREVEQPAREPATEP